MNNFKSIVTSPRFVQMLIIAILQALVLFNVIDTAQGTGLINIISTLLGASVVIRTVDRQSDVKAGITTVSMPQDVSTVTASTSRAKQAVNKKK